MRDIYAELLKRNASQIDRDRPFLGLGGDSLLAVFVIARLREAGFMIEVADVISNGSIAYLSQKLVTKEKDGSTEPIQPREDGITKSDHTTQNDDMTIAMEVEATPSSLLSSLDNAEPVLIKNLEQITQSPLDDIEAIAPCSLLQEKTLLGQEINPTAYQCSFTVKIKLPSDYDLQSISNLWTTVVSQRSILRTVFINSVSRPGHYDQVILREIQPVVQLVDVTNSSQFTGLETRKPTIPGQFQVPHCLHIIKSAPKEFYLKLDISHSLIDGHSAEVLLKDTCALLFNQVSRREILSYRDYVQYYHKLEAKASSSKYWLDYVSKAKETHVPMLKDQETMHDLKTIRFNLDISSNFHEFCERHKVTVANICQVAWGLVLRYYTGQDTVCFSYIASTREAPLNGIMEAVGPFINTLLCAVHLSASTKVSDALSRANEEYLEGMKHQNEFASNISARQWGNTVMSFRRNLDQDNEMNMGLECDVIDAYSPTDVSKLSVLDSYV